MMRNVIIFSLIALLLVGSAAAEATGTNQTESVPYIIAFLAGLISVISPCAVPLLFGYLTVISKEDGSFWLKTAAFFSGLMLVWVILGFTVPSLKSLVLSSRIVFNQIIGLLIMAFGFMYLLDISIPTISITKRVNTSIIGMFVFGMLFTLVWIPCVGPTLAAILVIAYTGSAVEGGLLMFVYALGFMVSMIVIFLALRRGRMRIHIKKGITIKGREISLYNLIAGIFLIIIGLIYFFDMINIILEALLPLSDFAYSMERVFVRNQLAMGLILLFVIGAIIVWYWKKTGSKS